MSGDEMDTDGPSRPIVRLVVVLLLLHIIVIGGILVRGHILKTGRIVTDTSATLPTIASKDITPPPANPSPSTGEGTPLVAAGGENNIPTDDSDPLVLPEPSGFRGPQIPSENPVDEPIFGADSPVPVTPVAPVGGMAQNNRNNAGPDTGSTPANNTQSQPIYHLALSGDSWESIALENGCSVQELKQHNPGLALRTGAQVKIPLPEGVVMAEVVEEASTGSGGVYIMKKGDNLSRIAKKHNTTVSKIMKINGFKESDTRKLQIGQQIKLP